MAVCTWVRNEFFGTVIVVENIVPWLFENNIATNYCC